jgi:hypothetical protein
MYTIKMRQKSKKCQQCHEIFNKPVTDSYDYFINRRKYCTSSCMAAAQKGKSNSPATQFKKGDNAGSKHRAWKGGKYLTAQGYVSAVTGIPGIRELEHRYVMEQHLGRKLTKNEHVHHLNGNRSDNRLSNLSVIYAS